MRRVATAGSLAYGGGSGVAPRRKGLRNRFPWAEAHGYRQIVAPRLREKMAALGRDAATGPQLEFGAPLWQRLRRRSIGNLRPIPGRTAAQSTVVNPKN